MAFLLFHSATEPVEEIDGSQGEGGGQVLRSSLALSQLLNIPVSQKALKVPVVPLLPVVLVLLVQ